MTEPVSPALVLTATGVRLQLHVHPRSSKNRIAGVHGPAVKVQVNAPPVDGAANEAVVAVVAKWLGVPRRSVRLVQGQTSREKVIEILSDDPSGLVSQVGAALRALVDTQNRRD